MPAKNELSKKLNAAAIIPSHKQAINNRMKDESKRDDSGERKKPRRLRIRLIANPTAGRAGERKICRVADYLRDEGANVDVCITRKRGDALEAALKAAKGPPKNIDLIAAAGGDGTINEVVNGIAGSSVPMGVIPLGTVNLFALETGIPLDILKACDVILRGTVKEVRVGRVDDRCFMLMAGIGFDADVVYKLDLGLKRRLGRLAYILTGFSRLAGYSYNRLNIELDGEPAIEGYSVIVGNMKYYGGTLSITPFADFEKETLDVCVFKGKGLFNMLRYAWGVMQKRHLAYRDVEYRTVKSLKVSSSEKTYIQIDGDTFGTLPAEFSKAKETIRVILPGPGSLSSDRNVCERSS